MRSLVQHAMASLPSAEWDTLGLHMQLCVFPPSRGVRRLQRLLLFRRLARMAAFLELLQPQSNPTLAPQATVAYAAASAYRVVRAGDHIVVMVGGWRTGYAHHGIAAGADADGVMWVVDFSQPGEGVESTGNKLRRHKLESFIGSEPVFGVVPYTGVLPYPDDAQRARTVQRAEAMVVLYERGQLGKLQCYDVLKWNCETFAGFCVTGEMAPSQQAKRLLEAITHDLRQGGESFLLQAVEVSSGLSVALIGKLVGAICKWLRGG